MALHLIFLVALAAYTGSVHSADWRTVSCSKMFEIGIGTFENLCDLETLNPFCASQQSGRSKVFASECHLKTANCIAERYRKQTSFPTGQVPSYAQDYRKAAQTSKCPNFNQEFCAAKWNCAGKSISQLCANNGKTYDNDCELKKAICEAQRNKTKLPFRVKSGACSGSGVIG